MTGELKVLNAFTAQSRNASANGSAVDLESLVNVRQYMAYLDVGSVSGTTPTLDVKFQESADGSTGWTDITGAAFTQVTAAGSQTLRFKTSKRYVRAVATIAGTSPAFVFGVYVIGVANVA